MKAQPYEAGGAAKLTRNSAGEPIDINIQPSEPAQHAKLSGDGAGQLLTIQSQAYAC